MPSDLKFWWLQTTHESIFLTNFLFNFKDVASLNDVDKSIILSCKIKIKKYLCTYYTDHLHSMLGGFKVLALTISLTLHVNTSSLTLITDSLC